MDEKVISRLILQLAISNKLAMATALYENGEMTRDDYITIVERLQRDTDSYIRGLKI